MRSFYYADKRIKHKRGESISSANIYRRLSALSDPTRVRLLRVLEGEALSVGELVRVLQVSQPTVSRHLKQLRDQGWVDRRAVGTSSVFRMAGVDAEGRALWALVRAEVCDTYPEDQARLRTVVALRNVDSRTFFERVGGEWDALRKQLFGDGYTLPTLLALLPEGLRVADLGCGTGDVVAALAPYAAQVVGVDREQAMLDAAGRRLADAPNVELRSGSLDALPIEAASMDAALCMLVLHHVEAPAPVFVEAARVLRPGGRLVVLDIDAHDREEYRQTMGHVHLGFSAEALAEYAVAAGLTVVTQRVLPVETEALGPPLRLAILTR